MQLTLMTRLIVLEITVLSKLTVGNRARLCLRIAARLRTRLTGRTTRLLIRSSEFQSTQQSAISERKEK